MPGDLLGSFIGEYASEESLRFADAFDFEGNCFDSLTYPIDFLGQLLKTARLYWLASLYQLLDDCCK